MAARLRAGRHSSFAFVRIIASGTIAPPDHANWYVAPLGMFALNILGLTLLDDVTHAIASRPHLRHGPESFLPTRVLIGNTAANGSNIGPSERWLFKAYGSQRFDHAKLISVDIY